jgi:hypothetical protein
MYVCCGNLIRFSNDSGEAGFLASLGWDIAGFVWGVVKNSGAISKNVAF